jgi:hypothetical protein
MVMRASHNARAATALFAGVVPACFNPVYDHPRCEPDGTCPEGMLCVQSQNICESKNDRSFDTAASFAPGQRVNMTLDAAGALTPTAYTYGGLVAYGLEGRSLWEPGATDWGAVESATPTGAGLWRGEPIASTDDLRYLGLSNKAVLTIWLEGEVWLDAGAAETFSVQADNVGFLELALPGTAAFAPLVDSSGNVAGTNPTPFHPPETGWYPIRIGFSDSDNLGGLVLMHRDGAGPFVAWTRERLRARASELRGALRTVFFQQMLGGGANDVPPVATFERGDLLRQTSFAVVPQGTTRNVDWSARYFAQVYIETAGSYTLSITSDDGNRGRLADSFGQASWARGSANSNAFTEVTATLRAGWNDLAVDYNQVIDNPTSLALHVQLGGPDFSNIEVPADRLRPVESADDRLVYGGNDANITIPTAGGVANAAEAVMPVVGFPGETVASLDILSELESQHWEQIRVDLETPGGTRVTIRADDSSLGQGDKVAQLTVPSSVTGPLATMLGGPAHGTWKLHVYNNTTSGGPGVLFTAKLTLHSRAGPERIARAASWTSPVLDFETPVMTIEDVTSVHRTPSGTGLAILVRGCQQADCSDGMWAPALHELASIEPARYLQLRAEMTSDGVNEPELRSVRIQVR